MEASLLTQIVLPLSLFIIMLGMGLSLTSTDFRNIPKTPKPLFIGLFGQFMILPILAFLVAIGMRLEPKLAMGLMILSFCPGGVTSNMYSHLSRANVALSISLTTIVSLITPITIPLLIAWQSENFFGLATSVELPIAKTILTLLVITIIPVIIGMTINKKRPQIAQRYDKPVKILSMVLLFIITFGICLENWDNLPRLFATAGPACLLLNIIAMTGSFYGARAFKLGRKEGKTICLEVGLQNGTTALFITSTILEDPVLSIPAATYSLIMFATGAVAAYVFSKSDEKTDLEPTVSASMDQVS